MVTSKLPGIVLHFIIVPTDNIPFRYYYYFLFFFFNSRIGVIYFFVTELPSRYSFQPLGRSMWFSFQRTWLLSGDYPIPSLWKYNTWLSLMNSFTLQVKAIETENSRLLRVDHSFRCPGNGNWPHPVHCHYFYTCYDHHLGAEPAQLWQCEKDFLYDVRHRKCRFSKNIVCGNRLQPKKH